MTQGIVVHGGNHFIVNGPAPTPEQARQLARRWELPEIGGGPAGTPWREWSLCTRAFREDLAWAVVIASPDRHTDAVERLLQEVAGRGIAIVAAQPLWP